MIACPCEVCHSANPRDKRLRSSILVQSATTTLVVDTGPDFRYQMLRANVTHLDAKVWMASFGTEKPVNDVGGGDAVDEAAGDSKH